MTVAPGGISRLAPTDLILSPSMMMTWFVDAVPVSGSISRPALIAVIAVDCAADDVAIKTTSNREKSQSDLRINVSSRYLIAMAFGGEATPPSLLSGAAVKKN